MELTDDMRKSGVFTNVPLQLHIGDETIIDDETFDQISFLEKMNGSPECPKSSCPAPEAFEQTFEGADEIFVVSISSQLSGTYNSAKLAMMDYQDQHPEVKIHVIDSKSASCGETLIGRKIQELKSNGLSFETVVDKIEEYRDQIDTKFVLESLDNLHKNGRLTGMTALICHALNIKPVMCATPEGTIDKLSQARGMKNALNKMVASMAEDVGNAKEKILAISHCNNAERARYVKEQVEKVINFREILILEQRGLSTLYANEGGIIVAY